MSADQERRSISRSWLRIGLALLAVTPLSAGLWALSLPRMFYDDFPLPGRYWVSALGPYNEHLVRDYGALNLALGVLLVFAAVSLEGGLVRASLSFTRRRISSSTSPRSTPFVGRQRGATGHSGVPGLAPAGVARTRRRARRAAEGSRTHVGDVLLRGLVGAACEKDEP